MAALLENKHVRSLLIGVVSLILTAATDRLTLWLAGQSLDATTAAALVAAWASIVNAIQLEVRKRLGTPEDAADAELRRQIADRPVDPEQAARMRRLLSEMTEVQIARGPEGPPMRLLSPGEYVELVEPRTLDPNSVNVPFGGQSQPRTVPKDDDGGSPLIVLALIAWLLTCSAVVSAGEAMIVGPAAVPAPGYPCQLYLQGDLPEGTTIGWDISPRDEQITLINAAEDGRSARLHTMAGRWRISVAVHEPNRAIYFRYFDFSVPGMPYVPPDGPTPRPEPQPKPSPTPGPPAPAPNPAPSPSPTPPTPSIFGVKTRIAEIVARLKSADVAQQARQLATAADGLAAEIAAGTVPDVTAVLTRIGEGIRGLNSSAWTGAAPEFAAALKTVYEAHKAERLKVGPKGELSNRTEWAALLREIAAALRATAPAG